MRYQKAKVTALRLRDTAEARFPAVTHLSERMLAVNILDAATRLAAQCFLTAIPLLFVFASVAPEGVQNQLITSVRTVFGLTGATNAQLEKLYQSHSESLQDVTGVVGGLLVLVSATAVSRAMQRLCRRAWQVPKGGMKVAPWRWLVWIVVWLVVLVVQAPLHDGFGLGLWLGVPVTLVSQTALWWWSQHLLLGGHVRWLPLLPGAVLTAAAVTALSLGAQFYMPTALNRTLAEYGGLGPVFTILSWLIVLCAAVALAITVGAVVAQETHLAEPLGSLTLAPGSEEAGDGVEAGDGKAGEDGDGRHAAEGEHPADRSDDSDGNDGNHGNGGSIDGNDGNHGGRR
ncbi:YhjD/YihY/BrkB family envelope integrity protein [Streptomyces sp. NPDC048338]|uniref:YhjD/YihY/BrkB family envelope integrity protein n=1 Tax=Streptomyces sp. NPDC048338 TaxID=3365536 RepID=UPI0037238D98